VSLVLEGSLIGNRLAGVRARFLQSIQLNDADHKVDWARKDLNYLLKRNYDAALTAEVSCAAS
jgi:hypothetical protein